MSFLNRFIDQAQSFRVAKMAGTARQIAEINARGAVNTYVSPKERDRRKKRKQIAKQSRLRNRL